MDVWLIWLIIAAVLAVAEIFTLTAALGLLGAAALITAGSAAIGLPVPLQLVVFTVVSAVGVLVVRPIALRHLLQPQAAAVRRGRAGRQARLRRVGGHGPDGRVRIGGEEWTARAYDETLVIPAGATVDVMEIEGATAIVYPRE